MKTLTDGQQSGLPAPPIATADVSSSQLPELSLNDAIGAAITSIGHEAQKIGDRRNDSKRGAGTLHGSKNSDEAHLIGCIGELIATTLGLPPTGQHEISPDGDSGWDHSLLDDETTIDTKTTSAETSRPRLIVDATDTPPADFFLLVHLQDDTGRIIGFVDRDTVTNRSPERWPGETENYIVTWDELYPPRFIDSLVIARTITETRDSEFVHPHACQLCGAHLDDDSEQRLFIREGLDCEVGVCTNDCASLLKAAQERKRATEFKLYERPPTS